MKLDATDLRYITSEEFKVLKAFEQGSKNHEIVPSALIAQISGLRHSGLNKLMGSLAKRNLIARVQNAKYDGYRLTYGGYDFLAVRALSKDDSIEAVGHQVGVGKESDIYIVSGPEEDQRILKIHRLGRISFRKVKEKRDYMGKRKSASWMYLSKLSAMKEFAFMQILHSHGFPVPRPIAQSRHCIVMSYISNAYPLRQVAELPQTQVGPLYSKLMKLIVRFARAGLIHGDFNEFNLMIKEVEADDRETEHECHTQYKDDTAARTEEQSSDPRRLPLQASDHERIEEGRGFQRLVLAPQAQAIEDAPSQKRLQGEEDGSSDEECDDEGGERVTFDDGTEIEPIVIDFPQMISVEHENAEYFFDRDVQCVRRFFRKRFRYISEEYPRFRDVVPVDRAKRREVAAAALRAKGKVLSVDDEESQIADEDKDPGIDPGIEDERDPELGEVLELDALVKASGFGAGGRLERDLEEHMRQLRLAGKATVSESDEEDDDDDDGDDDEEEGSDSEDGEHEGELSEGESLDEDGSHSASENDSKPRRRPAVLPSRGAAEKAAAEGDQRLIAMRVAAERARKTLKAEKHHGKKAHAGKTGRAHPGGKAKSDVVKNAMSF
ncbi:hypothetical protein K437DRAFT_258950 [Tilletiaria anomala UBC 951]|uniref:Serine/threonine-protein kinase RIO2 n=1 Tax=Tilletiaria anomala (strain ATCC 24038 / CBS 436.72 / UBC 951) TaxID=1037660 RepID=A0A066VLN3_TILAU|nr:uncharacterized protein K437DRAFT_258950 [Tilletiaria anomala UBC 951]KDN39679.1 hypothetical protein K437DRAFT_258950 [Tilletiaria anomala UBC 951]